MYKFFDGTFYPYVLRSRYESAGMWPVGGVDIDEDGFVNWMAAPEGKSIGVNDDGGPCWIDAKPYKPTFAQALTALNAEYVKDRDELCAAWLRAAVADGIEESSRKEDVEAELAELDTSHAEDVAALKVEYGVS